MRVDNIDINDHSSRAVITWEDSERPTETVFFDVQTTDADLHQDGLSDALLVGCAVLALWRGERRLRMHTPVCPLLCRNVSESLAYLRHWFYKKEKADTPELEVDLRREDVPPNLSRNAAVFFSGGIDSMFSLRSNHDLYPVDHSLRITKGVLVRGFEITDSAAFRIAQDHLTLAADSAGIELLVFNTNLYSICRPNDPHIEFLIQQFEGAFFASIAHALSSLIDRVALATTLDIEHLVPNGTHPLLRYSSANVEFSVDGTPYGRFKKAHSLIDWPPAMRFLRVCNKTERYRDEQINCGQCNKCVGAMLMFAALGVLHEFETFRGFQLTPALIAECLTPRIPFQKSLCRQIAERLRMDGKAAIADAVESRLSSYEE